MHLKKAHNPRTAKKRANPTEPKTFALYFPKAARAFSLHGCLLFDILFPLDSYAVQFYKCNAKTKNEHIFGLTSAPVIFADVVH